MSETQMVSAEVAKLPTNQIPDILKGGGTDWNSVKRIDNELDNIPTIDVRGGKLEIDKQPNIDGMKRATRMQVNGQESPTNLVDYLTGKDQLTTMLKEGVRLGAIKDDDLISRGIDPSIFHIGKGEQIQIEVPNYNSLQKAEALSLIAQKLGYRFPHTTTLFIDELTSRMLDAKKITHIDKDGKKLSSFSNLDILNVLSAAGRNELSKYVLEKGYRPHSFAEGADEATRRILAKLVKRATDEGPYERYLEGETPYFVEGKPEYSAMLDLKMAQAAYNALLPADTMLELTKLQLQLGQESDLTTKEDLRHQLVKLRQKTYAALLNAFGVEGYEDNGTMLAQMDRKEQNSVIELANKMKELKENDKLMNLTMYEANRVNLAKFTAQVLGCDTDSVLVLTYAYDLSENTVEQYRELYRHADYSEGTVNDLAYDRMAANYIKHVKKINPQKQLTNEEVVLLKTNFLERLRTEKSLVQRSVERSVRLHEKDSPTKVKLSEAFEMGLKGLDGLYRRTISPEASYKNYDQYLNQVKGKVKETSESQAQLRQGLEEDARLEAQRVDEEEKNKTWDEAHAENEVHTAWDEAHADDKIFNERRAQIEQEKQEKIRIENEMREEQAQADAYANREIKDRSPEELMKAVSESVHTPEQIQLAIDGLLRIGVNTPFKDMKRAFAVLKLGEEDKARYKTYIEARVLAMQIKKNKLLKENPEEQTPAELEESEEQLEDQAPQEVPAGDFDENNT